MTIKTKNSLNRRSLLKTAAATAGVTLLLNRSAQGIGPNDKMVMGAIGMGGRGRAVLGSFLGFEEVEVVAVCDVVGEHAKLAKQKVDQRYGNTDCKIYGDFREITRRDDIDVVLIATPDHWHAIISIDAMLHGKDVYCEKPETLSVGEGRRMVDIARRYGRVFSGGSQRVWGDYNGFHRVVRGGALGVVKKAWVNVGGPSGPCHLEPVETPPDVDWDMWLGPAPWRPYHPNLIKGGFRPYRDYSGGGTTDWGCHTFGGAMFALEIHESGPTEILPPDGPQRPQAIVKFADGIEIYHGGGWEGILNFEGTEGRVSEQDIRQQRIEQPEIDIPNYKGRGGIVGDFLHCVRTREKPFRDIERAHRTASVCHLLNLTYWLNRPIQWDAESETIVGDAEASRWLERTHREPWSLS
ncbi:MAG: Gfo/Idh/MocA family oxidoreductase [Planctomycetota bacterium]